MNIQIYHFFYTFIVTTVKFVDTILNAPIKNTIVVYTDTSGGKNAGLTDKNGIIIIKVRDMYKPQSQNFMSLPFFRNFY